MTPTTPLIPTISTLALKILPFDFLLNLSRRMRISIPLFAFFTALLLSLSFQVCRAQLTLPGQFYDSRFPTWQSDSIKKHGVSSITIRILDKPSSKPIRDTGKRVRYVFNARGMLTSFIKAFPMKDGRMDSTITRYEYDAQNRLKSQLEILGYYKRKTTYEQISDNAVKQTISVKHGSMEWQVLNVEVIQTEKSDKWERISIGGLNAKPYQKTLIERDSTGRMYHREVWVGSRLQLKEHWNFAKENNVNYVHENMITGERNSMQQVGDNGSFCHDYLCKNWSIVTGKKGHEEGWIFMNPATQDVEVWEFDYAFGFKQALSRK